MKRKYYFVIVVVMVCLLAIVYHEVNKKDYGHKVVVCIPVYGQSLALGEEAVRITDFDSLRLKYNDRIVTENMDYAFGYFDHSSRFKQNVKKLLHYDKKAFELSVYGMAEKMVPQLGEDTLICIFPGGHGMNTITQLMKPAAPYLKFIGEIKHAYEEAEKRGWTFIVPAVCWMQGESDIVDYPGTDYKKLFQQMYMNLNMDIKAVTHQSEDIRIICYQTNAVTKGTRYKENYYNTIESQTPTIQMEMIRDDSLIWASGPVYPYNFVNENIHIDAEGQKCIGGLAAQSALGILHHQKRRIGLVPLKINCSENNVEILFNVPSPPLCFDTIQVRKAPHYGFNVINKDNSDIISSVSIEGNSVILTCNESPIGCKVRYAVNGEYLKGGRINGPRGNLRDSQGEKLTIGVNEKELPLHNWCCQFDLLNCGL